MPNQSEPSATLRDVALPGLQHPCQTALDAFHQTHTRHPATTSCDEIVRRAATGDRAALQLLLELSYPLLDRWLRRHAPAHLTPDDLAQVRQEVVLRISTKFTHRDSPFQAQGFPSYRKYLHTAARWVLLNLLQDPTQAHNMPPVSLDEMQAVNHPQQPTVDATTAVEHKLVRERLLTLLPDAHMREVFRRYFQRESVEEIAAALRLTRQEVYRLTERAVRFLSGIPEVREMLEADGT